MVRFTIFPTSWGSFGIVVRGKRLLATYLPDRAERIRRRILRTWPDAVEDADALPGFRGQVTEYFDGRRTKFEVDLDLSDVPMFHRAVLNACRRIPFGQTATYAELARTVGKPGAARAVGQAMGGNPLPLVVPCHRVVRSDGSLGGFSSPQGIQEKARLLRHEGAGAKSVSGLRLERLTPSNGRRSGRRPLARHRV